MSHCAGVHTSLKEIVPFSLLTNVKFDMLAREIRHRRHTRSEVILKRGEREHGLHVLLRGRAETVFEDARGRAMTLTVIEQSELFGNIGLFDGRAHAARVCALEACETVYVPHAAFLEAIADNYPALLVILQLSEARLEKAHEKIATLGLLDVYARVARVFVDCAERVNDQWIVASGMEQIARTVAASREMVSRVVKNMNESGLVRRDKRKTVILDWQAMSAACRL